MTHIGRVTNGNIILEGEANLPEGATVEVRVVKTADTAALKMNLDLAKYFGMADDLPSDSSVSVERVLYGNDSE